MAIYVQLKQRRRHVARSCPTLRAVERAIERYNQLERDAGGNAEPLRFDDRVLTMLREPPAGSELARWLERTKPCNRCAS